MELVRAAPWAKAARRVTQLLARRALSVVDMGRVCKAVLGFLEGLRGAAAKMAPPQSTAGAVEVVVTPPPEQGVDRFMEAAVAAAEIQLAAGVVPPLAAAEGVPELAPHQVLVRGANSEFME